MPKYRIALLIVLAGTLALVGYLRYQQYTLSRDRKAYVKYHAESLAKFASYRLHQDGVFQDDSGNSIPGAYPRPQSDWIANQQHFYERLLAGHHYEILVVPLQVDGMGFDRATRLLMTTELTTAIAQATARSVPDPYTIDKIFGEGRRAIDISEIYRIANLVGARRIIWGAAGHDQQHTMHVKVLSQTRTEAAGGPTASTAPIELKSFDKIPYDHEHSPLEGFEQRMPEIIHFLGSTPSTIPAAAHITNRNVLELPLKPLALLTDTPDPAHDAYFFSLFYELTPAHVETTRELFAARAYMATTHLSGMAPEYRALRTRALMMLGYRSAALKALESPGNDEERELSAVLNGDLPQARLQASKAADPLKRLIERLDVIRIESDFGILTSKDALESVKSADLPGQIWPYLVARAATDWDPWSQFDNATLKSLMDSEFPIPGYTLQDLVRGQLTAGDPEKLQATVDLSVFNHGRTYLENSAKQWCCDLYTSGARAVDYLTLLSAIGHDNLIRRLNFLAGVQGSPAQALRYADSLQSVYKGDPYYALARSTAELQAAEQSGGAEQEGLMKAAYEDAFNAMYWEQAQSTVSSEAFNQVALTARQDYGIFDNLYAADIPFHPLYRTWGGFGNPAVIHANGQAALDNATSQFEAVNQLVENDDEKLVTAASVDALTRQMQGRFIGSPQRNIVLANQRLLLGDDQSAASLLRDNIKMTPLFQDSYINLARLTFELGQPSQAAGIFLSYPGLQGSSPDSPVAVANAAYDMGSYLYGSGDLKLAATLYRIAASQQSGAASEMASAARLKLLEDDIDGAAAVLLERAQRYNDSHSYRDLLSILHARKSSDEAWSVFNTVVRQKPDFGIWESAVVGHHMAGTSEAQVTQWVEQADLQRVGNRVSYATSYLVLFATTDRTPSESLAATVANIDRPTWQFEDGPLSVVRPDADDLQQHVLGPAGVIDSHGVLPNGAFNDPKKHRVRSPLSYFVDAYRALRLQDYSRARKIFDEASALYDMTSIQSSYMLPYFALASSKTGSDQSDVAAILARFSPKDRGFDYQLASAVVAGIRGKTGDSLASLRLARYRLPRNDDERPTLPRYTYGDICETLYRLTNDPKFRDEALDWVRSRERAEPWQSWSYAIDAALAPDPADRDRALAMLFYLDPGSSRLSSFKKSTVEAATRRFGDTNILKRKMSAGPRPTTT